MKTSSAVVVLVSFLVLPCVICLTLEEEIPSNSLIVTFKEVDLEQWTEDGSSSLFRTVVANITNTYCKLRLADCSLQSYHPNNSFTVHDVMITAGFPRDIKGNDLEVKFYVIIPSGSDITVASTDNVIAYDTLKSIIMSNEEMIEQQLGYTVMYIGDTLVLPPIDHTMNVIMIPISFALLVIVIVVAIGLQLHEKRRDKELHKARKARRSKISPTPENTEDGYPMKTVAAATNGEQSAYHEKTKSEKKKKKKRNDERSGDDNKGYAATPNDYNIKPNDQSTMKSDKNYDENLDGYHGSKRYDEEDKWDRSESKRSSRKYDDAYDSMEDTGRSRRHHKKKRKHRRHRDGSSENDTDFKPPSHLPPMDEPIKRHTTEI
ncbi:uncharacterized protein LOC100376395 [Saccoglossus kowalevskii]|uniref:Uncharacterized protein LOC100376395 n=1 Tax=Saccoglossus kowalevskii TaxID=10224 RepID=A0ABM0H1X1_SACKO|nr:PREDICTED: uncharacterized protein LOC100376395 [Saccoglossus kowalevskii]